MTLIDCATLMDEDMDEYNVDNMFYGFTPDDLETETEVFHFIHHKEIKHGLSDEAKSEWGD